MIVWQKMTRDARGDLARSAEQELGKIISALTRVQGLTEQIVEESGYLSGPANTANSMLEKSLANIQKAKSLLNQIRSK